ncbi:hypothetical protein Amsp01_090300 [Amycolatopsis sp. NBRC 101858]|uniref:DUF4192 domain-containing protein n=1 Tax=Amycolatopsis sp. NBRC 101858 TaxID=3032200 RepID=UPI00249FF91A|nr:DUF4192 domain-containing protein [Amycolatopsis sp. NBRC 101858]GLY43007.1 hypothetical protein Amsp01_090300 [Amycolatopsis sp. NBRC 101858]
MSLTLASTTAVVASIPALIGFVPDDSLMLITTLTNDDGTVTTGPLTRIDLTHLTGHADDCVRQFNRQCGDLPVLCVTGILVRTVDEDATSDDTLPLRAEVDTVVKLLAGHGFTDVDLVHVPAITEGARWRSYLEADRSGVLPDPATTAAAAAAVAAGHTIAASRDDLAARFTPAPEQLRARLQPRITDAVERAVIDQHGHLAAHARLARADAAIRAATHGNLPADDAAIADLAATFATLPFRDALLAVPDHTARSAAGNLVLHLWRHSCDPIAGQLATVIAVHAYLRGDGTGARIALENADPEQPMTALLSTLLHHAVPPSKIHHVIHNASADARRTLLSEPAVDQA